MLAKFTVSNFKSFNKEFTLELNSPNGYNFNTESIKNGIVNNALIYGHNGVGKSNLGIAMFDIVKNLTDFHTYDPSPKFLNYYNDSLIAKFSYLFKFGQHQVEYNYGKFELGTFFYENISINGKKMAEIDRSEHKKAKILFKGAETLKREFNQNLSLLKYIKNNAVLDENEENNILLNFFNFVDKMLFFRSLDSNSYIGFGDGQHRDIHSGIIENGNSGFIENDNLNDLQIFLNAAGIDCKLTIVEVTGAKVIAFDFNGIPVPYPEVASTGTRALIAFYYWLQKLRKSSNVKFLFLDEFDAFYHHELSQIIIKELIKTGVQFILTTHNTSNISNDLLRPDCYFLMQKESIKSLAKSTLKELRGAHNIEKMYKAGSFNG